MKRFLILVLTFLMLPAYSAPVVSDLIPVSEHKPFEIGVSFDWFSKTQFQRDENIKQIQDLLALENPVSEYSKKDFKNKYADFLKNKNYLNDYDEISKGKKEDNEKIYCGFFVRKLLVAYGIQYKKEPAHIYYYDAMGNLRWVDVFSKNYPEFPYWSYQYERNGKMIAAYYYVSDYDQYVFNPQKEFCGRWYKDKLYSRKAKVIMTRSNYGKDTEN